MKRALAVVAGLSVALLAAHTVRAEPVLSAVTPNVVISHVQAGATGDAAREMIGIYNNGLETVDITGWCLTNKSSVVDQALGLISKPVGCLNGAGTNERLLLPGFTYAVLASENFIIAHPDTVDVSYDGVFEKSVTITASTDTIGLYDASRTQIDALTWTSTIEAGKVFVRKIASPPLLIDTGVISDFEKLVGPIIPLSGVEYVRTVEDVCGNLEDIQEALPVGYGYDEAGNCELLILDVCNNIDAVQIEAPEGFLPADDGGCYVDVCSNIAGLQQHMPPGFTVEDNICIALESRALRLNEIFANATGSDTGREFIELYNPNDEPVDLRDYVLLVGKLLENDYVLAAEDETIPAYGYLVLYGHEIGFTLLNTSSSVQLRAPSGAIVSDAVYLEPSEDESWSWIGDAWQYTDQLTPGFENRARVEFIEEVQGVSTSLLPCHTGKYRHPVTNRCRNIDSDAAILAACDSDEYRSPETNRCRKVASLAASLTPCNDGYERNLETNRCRKVTTAAKGLSACQSGYERNPATNRCRKSFTASSVATTASAVETSSPSSVITNALIITTGLGAVGYGLYEWRSEFVRGARRLAQMITGK